MSNINRLFAMIRAVVLGVTSLFAIIVLVMAALVTNFTTTYYYGAYFTYAAFAMATALLTLLTLPVMLALSIVRKGAFTSMIIIELIWTGLLWILWLATGGVTASTTWINYCSTFYYSVSQEACMETQALTAFAFLNWIALMVSNIFLFSLAIRQHNRGHTNIWTSYVTDTDFTAPDVTQATEKVNSGFAPQYTGSTYVGTPQPVMTPFQNGPVVAQV